MHLHPGAALEAPHLPARPAVVVGSEVLVGVMIGVPIGVSGAVLCYLVWKYLGLGE